MRYGRVVPALLLLVVGCARYEYDLIQPAGHAGHIGKEDLVVVMDPLEYRMRTVESRLVVRVFNGTGEMVELLPQSSVIDPTGQAHPVRPQTIPAGAFVKMILPPVPPTIRRSGPSIGIGVGGAYSRRGYWGRRDFGYYDYYDEPRYYSVYDPSNETYWEWRGTGPARLVLVYRRNGKEFTDEFVVGRVKV